MTSENPHCCPKGSDPAVSTEYVPKGKIESVNDLKFYTIGNSENVILVCYDIFGLEEGSRIKQVSDQISENGYKVIIIDFFRGWAHSKGILLIIRQGY